MVCVICVYGPQTRRTYGCREGGFHKFQRRLAGLRESISKPRFIDGQTMLCVAGDFNVHIGVVEPEDEESIGRFGWGTRNREGRDRTGEDVV